MKIPAEINKRFGSRSEKVVKKRTIAIRKGWRRKTLKFLEQKPICFKCKEELHHFSRTMLCNYCRIAKNKANHLSRNPGYLARHYQENKERILAYQRSYYLIYKDEICLRLRIKYAEKKRENYEDSLRFKLGRLERDVWATGLCPSANSEKREARL